MRVGVVLWRRAEDALADIKLSAIIGGDFVARNLWEATAEALSDEKLVQIKSDPEKVTRRKPRTRAASRTKATSPAR